jgi:hypothetical protein
MILKQYYLGCLAHASYLIVDERTKQAIVVDPQRDIEHTYAMSSRAVTRSNLWCSRTSMRIFWQVTSNCETAPEPAS